jgi:hypothetical protein
MGAEKSNGNQINKRLNIKNKKQSKRMFIKEYLPVVDWQSTSKKSCPLITQIKAD